MTYSGSAQSREARESLGKALAALQEDPNLPPDVMAIAQNIAQAVGALFEAERASTEPDGKSSIRSALSSLSQTLALLQDVRAKHRGISVATEVLAKTMSTLYPLTTVPSKSPPPPTAMSAPNRPSAVAAPPPPAETSKSTADVKRTDVEANIGATTESNFYVGFSGEISEGGVFLATYDVMPKGSAIRMLVTLPGGFEFRIQGRVRFVRDPMDMGSESEPGMGVQFENLDGQARDLILRFIRKRPPMFYDE